MAGRGKTASKSTTARSGTRAPWGSITRQQIVDVALKAVQAGGYQSMTIRSLAGDLGVGSMSLYRHVRDKDDLLDEVVDRLLKDVWEPPARESDWRGWVTQAADIFRQFLVTQPAALHVYLSHPVVSPASIERMESMIRVLGGGLSDERAARRAYAAIHTYTIGFAALEASRAGWDAAAHAEDRMANRLAAFTTPRQFADGLQYLLDGIEGRAAKAGRVGRR